MRSDTASPTAGLGVPIGLRTESQELPLSVGVAHPVLTWRGSGPESADAFALAVEKTSGPGTPRTV